MLYNKERYKSFSTDDMQVSVSTRQASALLGVHESSVKRWCNAEELECQLTPGGHRRIPIRALVAFARGQGIQVPLRHFGQDAAPPDGTGCHYYTMTFVDGPTIADQIGQQDSWPERPRVATPPAGAEAGFRPTPRRSHRNAGTGWCRTCR